MQRLLIFLLLSLGTPAVADEYSPSPGIHLAKAKKKKKSKKKKKGKGKAKAEEGSQSEEPAATQSSSMFHGGLGHDNKNIYAGARLGFISYPIFGFGLEGAYHLLDKVDVGAMYLFGSRDFTSDVENEQPDLISIDDFSITAKFLLFFGRYSVLDYLYVGGGFGTRTLVGDYTISAIATGDLAYGTVESNSIALYFSTGSFYHFPFGLTLGVDFLGYVLPLTENRAQSITTEGVLNAAVDQLEAKVEQEADRIVKKPALQLLLFNAGYRF